jgi:hypothetical protein
MRITGSRLYHYLERKLRLLENKQILPGPGAALRLVDVNALAQMRAVVYYRSDGSVTYV